jgi:hypothetical protein
MSLSPQTIRLRHRLRQWQKSGRKHWDLYRYLYNPFLIHDALRLVLKNAGSGGLDGVRVQDIRGEEWDYVKRIIEEIRAGRYAPSAVKRVYIPKSDGSQRPLGIPNIVDRVVQRALVLLLEPIYEMKFHSFSYGFRPNRRAVDAAAIVAKESYRLRQVFDADIEGFFDQVQHRKLVGMIKQDVVDPRILKLIKQFLRSGFQAYGECWQASRKGTPQGGPLSPLLANIYLQWKVRTSGVAKKSAKAEVERCEHTDIQLGNEIDEIRNQGPSGWCLYYAASDLFSFETNSRISAVNVAISMNEDESHPFIAYQVDPVVNGVVAYEV